ncbi:hypothetical protein RSJ42_07820 [Methanosarcina hadiensis]|uniref:hypothetical protein n=1 Tax=Methanosarcina hadiensis TaxID=3078083 RepID=UPI0039779CD0
MVKFTHVFVVSILIFWLVASGCTGNDTDSGEADLQEMPGADGSENASVEQLTEADIHEFEQNVTDLEELLNNSSEEIVVEGL